MALSEGRSGEERQQLHHEAWPGYRKVFNLVFGLFCLYLAYVFVVVTGGGH